MGIHQVNCIDGSGFELKYQDRTFGFNGGHGHLFSRAIHALAYLGLALITYSIVCLCISMGMFVYFIAFEIPRLDEHLGKKYGNEFAEYSQVTKRFVPFVY